MRVEVCYALPERQDLVALELPAGASVGAALHASGLLERHGLDEATLVVGVFSRLCALDAPLAEGDRVEIYRPLVVDAKTARRMRAAVKARVKP